MSYKDSPKPLRKSDSNPLFNMEDDGYVVKSENAIQRQRREDGTQHSFTRPSAVQAKEYELFIGEEKVTKSVSAQMETDTIKPDEVIKAYMGKDDDEEDEEKSFAAGKKLVNTVASAVPTPNHK